ncbi:NAD-dependent epimerase/dehydratase family protein [Agrococcus jejuensis]|uniref:Nucleoside-diphosphate-sugar epimerase n=1 Tax=Agrococcus jejuensis TaxID=399736 RepID=A0A1G8EQ10_9MICO|nr:NAD-dependent epimerase/dehydratase family protein [Agrococcus jejuensis]SDH71799.1 Nucleoside-diphosphate-sugar epimerase [Agrococcus jejuensis]
MRAFVTGASGWIGSATVAELIEAGHEVVGLVRSDRAAAAVEALGATALRGDLDDLDSLRRGADAADAVVHLANKHDWANPAESNRAERAAVETLADALRGSDHRLVLASGLAMLGLDRAITEADETQAIGPDSARGGAEHLALSLVDEGVASIAMRFAPTVHGRGDHGFIAEVVAAAARTGVAGYVGDGTVPWAAVHRSDAARLVRLAAEGAPAGARLHAVAETAVTGRAIAEAIGARLGLPTASIDPADAVAHFGFIGRFLGVPMAATSTATQAMLGWTPTGPTLVDDLAAGAYDHAA